MNNKPERTIKYFFAGAVLLFTIAVLGHKIIDALYMPSLAQSKQPAYEEDVNDSIDEPEKNIIAENINFFNPNIFWPAVDKDESAPRIDAKGLIMPHHLLPIDNTAKLYQGSADSKIRTVIVIGPNHENIGTDPIAATYSSWNTGIGRLDSDREMLGSLLTDFGIADNPAVFTNEHSIGAHVPFIKYYFPKARLVPIVLSSNAGYKQAEKLSAWLSQNCKKDCLAVFSVDFSHYLSYEQAQFNDALTRKWIESKDFARILPLNNDFLDSPAAITTALLWSRLNDLETDILQHGNSFEMLENKPDATTSYFWIAFK